MYSGIPDGRYCNSANVVQLPSMVVSNNGNNIIYGQYGNLNCIRNPNSNGNGYLCTESGLGPGYQKQFPLTVLPNQNGTYQVTHSNYSSPPITNTYQLCNSSQIYKQSPTTSGAFINLSSFY